MGMPFQYSRNQALKEYLEFLSDSLKDAGFKVELKTLQSRRSYDLVTSEEMDSSPYDDLAISEGRDKVISVRFPIIYTKGRIFYRKDSVSFNAKKLNKYTGALSQNNALMDKEAKQRQLKFISTVSPYQSIQLLLERKIDYFLSIEEVGISAVNSTPEGNSQIKMSDVVFNEAPIYFTMQKKFKKDLPKIEMAFRKHLTGNLSQYPLIKANLNKYRN